MLLRTVVQPESWRDEAHPQAVGEIYLAASPPDLTSLNAAKNTAGDLDATSRRLVTERAVLIIRQTHATPEEIAKVIRRVESGDTIATEDPAGMGGGFFSVPVQ